MTRKTTDFALFTSLAFIFSYIENLIPIPLPFPGMKLGLANLVLVILLYQRGFRYALGVSMVRTILTAVTFGNLFMYLYSVVGALLSISFMGLLKRFTSLHMITISIAGGIAHNFGQILVAILVVHSTSILSYLPILYFVGGFSGLLIGILGNECNQRLHPLSSNRN